MILDEEGFLDRNFTVCTVLLIEVVRLIKSRRFTCTQNEKGRSAFKMLSGKPTGKRRLGRPRRRWEDNIRMGLRETGINTRNWVDSAQDRDYWRALVNAALNLRVPYAMEGVS